MPKTASESKRRSAGEAGEAFLSQEVAWEKSALTRANRVWWQASLSGKASDYRKLDSASRAINRHYARRGPFARIARLLAEPSLPELERRRLERLERQYRGMQAPLDLLDRITADETAISERYSTFRGTFEGESVSDNALEDVLRETTDSERARAAWEARKQIGAVVAEDLRALAELRNEAARAAGFADFWHQQLVLEELDPAQLVATLEQVDSLTSRPFAAMKRDLDRILARRFGVSQKGLRPWHYGDPFFQETPDVFAPPADPLFAERDVVALAAQTYRDLEFPGIDAILERSDLYPRPGKNQHAYAVDIDREGDVRTFLNVQPNARWMSTLLHELGHTIYQDGVDRTTLPYDLRDDPQGFMNEGFAMFCEQPLFDPSWLEKILGVESAEAERLGPELLAQDTASLLAFVRWCLTIVYFERAFYANPRQDLNTLWWDLVEQYQHVSRPEGRDEPDWATKIHVATSPVYYHKYLYGRLFSTQLTAEIVRRFGGWAGHPEAGAYVQQELFKPGATFPWTELVERVTGKPLGVDALAAAVAWPVSR